MPKSIRRKSTSRRRKSVKKSSSRKRVSSRRRSSSQKRTRKPSSQTRSSKKRSRKNSIKTFSGKRTLNPHPKRTSPIRVTPEDINLTLAEKYRSASLAKFPSLRQSLSQSRLRSGQNLSSAPFPQVPIFQLPKSAAEIKEVNLITITAKSGNTYSLDNQIGNNGESIAYEGKNVASSEKVFIKVLPRSIGGMASFLAEEQLAMLQYITQELASEMNNEIIPLLDNVITDKKIYLIFKWNKSFPLYKLPIESRQPQILKDIYNQIYHQLEVLHKVGILHGRIAPKNILLSFAPSGKVVATLSDIGKSCVSTEFVPKDTSRELVKCKSEQAIEKLNYYLPPSKELDHLALVLVTMVMFSPGDFDDIPSEVIEALRTKSPEAKLNILNNIQKIRNAHQAFSEQNEEFFDSIQESVEVYFNTSSKTSSTSRKNVE